MKRGVGVSSVTKQTGDLGLKAHLEDGTTIDATHAIGADGKWSKISASFPTLSSQSKMVTCPSFGVLMNSPTTPKTFETDRTYVINPPKECMFYIIASPLPTGGYSISIVCYDETLKKYPWLTPPADMKPGEYGKGGWEDEFSAMPKTMTSAKDLSQQLEDMFKKEVPEFYKLLDTETFRSVRINRRTTWLQYSPVNGKEISYSTEDGLVALVGDAAHAMTPSMGEGCNCALESAVKLVDGVSAAMKDKGESTCSISALSEGFVRYGLSRPAEVIPIQEASAARNVMKKPGPVPVKNTTPTPKDMFLHSKDSKAPSQ